jgi:DNA/RNA endonuclease YhcR with UshA esterase domain
MSTIIKIKKSSATSAPGSLGTGELAYTYGTGTSSNLGDRLFIGTGTETAGAAANIEVVGGKYFIDLLDHTHGTVNASSALIVDSNSKLDVLSIDNLKLDGNTISNTDTNGDINITPNGTGSVVLDSLSYPQSDGTSGQFLTTDGSGTLSFSTVISNFTIDADSGTSDTFNTGETLTFTGGEGIDTTVTNNTITITGEDATTTNKGIASFNSNDFSVTSGAVSLGSLANNQLDNSTVSYGGVQLSLGGTDATPAFNLSDATAYPGDSSLVTVGSLNGLTIAASKPISMGSNRVTNVADPTGAQDSATKSYVDATVNGLDVKDSVRVGTTANLNATYNNSAGTLIASASGAITVDSVSLAISDRILVKDQTASAQNGIYKVTTVGSGSASYILTRTDDGNTGDKLSGGSFFFIEEGTNNGDNGFVSTHDGIPTLGTTSIVFVQFSGAGQISAGAGMSKTGNTLDVEVDGSSIEIVSDTLQVKASGITNTMLAGLINLTTKVTDILPVGNGGTGASSLTANRLMIGNGTGAITVLAAGTAGQVLMSNGSSAPAFADIDGGTF